MDTDTKQKKMTLQSSPGSFLPPVFDFTVMNDITEKIASLGLNLTEAKIYLTGLAYASIGVGELARETNVKRTTVYHSLDTLVQKGLASKKSTNKKVLFMMTPPQHLDRLINQRIKTLEAQKKTVTELVGLLARQKRMDIPESTEVAQYEGEDGIRLVIEEALYCKSRRWDILAPTKNVFDDLGEEYKDYFYNAQRSRGISVRSLWEMPPVKGKHGPDEIGRRAPRLLPPAMRGTFTSVIILFDDKCAMIPPLTAGVAILISSRELCRTMRSMFEGLYGIAKPYNPYAKKR